MIVTIDGVAASGKSSVSSGVARALGIPYVSSGLLYRAATLLGLEARLDLGEAAPLLSHLQMLPLRLEPLPEGNRIWKGERDLTPQLRELEVDQTHPAHLDPSLPWPVDAGHQPSEGRLAGSRGPDDGEPLARSQLE